ncbi:hypothetical protein FSP39_000317 [Pinctada imbricata]|uniref:DSBA-like thioredoxin domain-containing protein n=1 Tax=Pinctada imbricata TaxID=66713 RepID=A0AA89C4C4_PINIB|nr:hypothetical protein FSP39_000317 [Pinctada imbricata]
MAMDSVKEKYDFRVRWEPFMLRPNTPPEGSPKPAQYTDPNNPRVAALKQSGADVGLDFTYKCPVFPNTIKPHVLMEYAKDVDDGEKQNQVAELLFHKYFTDGDALGDTTLLDVASAAGLDKDQLLSRLTDQSKLEGALNKALSWSNKGISGVPTFYMNGQKMFSGAQDKDTFIRVFEIVADKFPLQTTSKS